MFKFLKDKLKKAVSSFSQKVDEEGEKEEIEETPPEEPTSEPQPEAKKPEEPISSSPEKLASDLQESTTGSLEKPKDQESPSQELEPDEPISEEHKQETKETLQDVEKTVEEEASEQSIEEPTLAAVPDIPPTPDEPLEKTQSEDEVEEIIHQAETPPEKQEIPTEPLLHTEKKPEFEKEPEPGKKEEQKKPEPVQISEAEIKEEAQPKKGFFSSIAQKFHKEEEPKQEVVEEKPEETGEQQVPEEKGLFDAIKKRITTTKINEKQFEDMFADLEMAMLENNVAMEVIEKIKGDLKTSLVDQPIRRTKVEQVVVDSLKNSIKGLFMDTFDLAERVKEKRKKPFVIAFVGINGSGKTTSIAKLTSLLKKQGLEVVIAAADTFRAASIEQLSLHGERLRAKVIKHDYGSDPAAVAFDAIKHAKSKEADVVLIDTAGRMHKNANLMDEMKKIVRVAKPDLKIFVGESITGNDCIEQAKSFNEAVEIDGIILSKADVDEKGGAAVSVSYITQKPVLYFGVGQEYQDLKPFDHNLVMQNLGLA